MKINTLPLFYMIGVAIGSVTMQILIQPHRQIYIPWVLLNLGLCYIWLAYNYKGSETV